MELSGYSALLLFPLASNFPEKSVWMGDASTAAPSPAFSVYGFSRSTYAAPQSAIGLPSVDNRSTLWAPVTIRLPWAVNE